MTIYPAIDILQGNAVRLRQGKAEDVTVYGKPMEMASRWIEAGAEWLHVVDLDGAFGGTPKNHDIVREIAKSFPKVKVQIGGGIRQISTVEQLLDNGVHRAILGTSAVTDTAFVREALKRYPGRIAVGIDARDGIAKVSGWKEDSRVGAIDLARQLEALGAEIVIYTDIARDGVLVGPNLEAMRAMIRGTGLRVIASGGVAKLQDVHALAGMNEPRLDGVIIGKALYEGLVRIEDALLEAAG
jgi:phosphoribosylformimino-5-aminoimidazole carboxamide ribotide isomerase